MPAAQFVTVTEAESGQKLLQFLERRLLGEVPRSAIQRWIRKGQVRVDKGRKKPFDRISAGQTVRIPPYTPGNTDTKPKSTGTLDIVFEDTELLALAKPAGLAVHGGDGIEDSIAARIVAAYPDADFRPTLAHRLDRDTSGLLLAAKSYTTLRTLNERFATGTICKLYLAWVLGSWDEPSGTLLEDRLEKQGLPGNEKVHSGSGKIAKAKVYPLHQASGRTLVAIRLLTGRTHQIRVQLASRGCPVAGDRKYGTKARGPMRLHCFAMNTGDRTLSLAPPWSGSWEVPADALQTALEHLHD